MIFPTKKPKLIVCDVDKTLTSANTWFELTKALGGDIEQHFQFYKAYLNNEESLEVLSGKLLAMLEKSYGRKIHKEVLYDIFFRIPLKGEAYSTFIDLRELGYELILISSSMDMFIEIVANRLQIPHWYANSVFQFDENGYWIGFAYDKNESELKLKQLLEFIQKHGFAEDECIVLGDSKNDVELFKHFSGVAVDTDDVQLTSLAWKEIKFLPSLLQILEELQQ